MANLAEAVDAAETDWLVSADIPDTVDYLTVESEVVQVTATFPAQYQARDGSTSDPRIRVVRAAGGTTAASHADGTTLTPLIPPSAGGGAAEAGTVVVTPPTEVDIGAALEGANAPDAGNPVATLADGQGFYAQATDPGAVGAGKVWKDISLGTAGLTTWWERNAEDTGWEPFAAIRAATADDSQNANAGSTAESTNGAAAIAAEAMAAGSGNASASRNVTASGGGDASATTFVTASGGAGLGSASAGTSANSVDGLAQASLYAEATGSGGADVSARAATGTGIANAGSLAVRGAASAGMLAEVDGTSARMAFNGWTPIPIPVIPAVPDAQDIADVLVALGLATQTP